MSGDFPKLARSSAARKVGAEGKMHPRRATITVSLFSQMLLLATMTGAQGTFATSTPTPSNSHEIRPLTVQEPEGITREPSGLFSQRTLRVAIEVDRDQARLIRYTLKDTPFIRPLNASGSAREEANPWVEVALLGPEGKRYTRGFGVPLCFEHSGDSEPHVTGDLVQLHRDIFVIELPELDGFDRMEISTYAARAAGGARRVQVAETLDERRFTPAGRKARYRDLVFAIPSQEAATAQPSPNPPQPDGVIWPEDIGDPEIYRVEGVESEGTRRINVIVVPDAYLPEDKSLMLSNFSKVSRLVSVSPISEHANLINYVLVFAYSVENGPDQCDCGVVRDTAMGTRFADLPPPYEGCGGHSCLLYGNPRCDQDRTQNIAEAELRAPVFDHSMGDTTLVLVHSSRVGGCAISGDRTVVSGNSPQLGTWHEMGHGWASLRDEYVTYPDCGHSTSEINTSRNPEVGAWPEWIEDLGPPTEGADHFGECIYKPTGTCLMTGGGPNSPPFCPVCTQRWPLVFYGSPRVSPTAPIESMSPTAALNTQSGAWTNFGVTTRLPSGASITNEITWQIQGPGYPSPVTIATGNPTLRRSFDLPGDYALTVKVIADANLVKPAKYGPNLDIATWDVSVTPGPPPLEVSPPGSAQPVTFSDDATLIWEDGAVNRSAAFNLYRGSIADLAQGSYGTCLASSIPTNTASDLAQPEIDQAWFYLVAGRSAGVIGTLGQGSDGSTRGDGPVCP
jgi:hypothetical protein